MTTTLDSSMPADGRPAVLPRDPRERLAALFDAGTLELLPADGDEHSGVIAGVGLVHGAGAVAFACDPRLQGGAMGGAGCAVIVGAYTEAVSRGVPIVGLWHSGGARLAEGVASLHAVGTVFAAMTAASGRVPQISVVLGPAAGGAAYGPALTDIVILSGQGRLFVTGPDVVRSVTGEDVDAERLGGPEPHSRRSGVVHVVTETDAEALDRARQIAALLSDQGKIAEDAEDRDLSGLLPESARRAYDVHVLTDKLLDAPGVELHPRWAPNIVTCWAAWRAVRSAWWPATRCGSAAAWTRRRPRRRPASSGCATRSGCRSWCWWTCPATCPASGQEWDGVVRRGAKLLHAFSEASVPRVTLVTRKAYGGAYIAMNCRALGATRVFAWPGAEVAVMGAVAAIRILHRRTLASVPPERLHEVETELAAEHEARRRRPGPRGRARRHRRDHRAQPDAPRAGPGHRRGTPARGTHANIPL